MDTLLERWCESRPWYRVLFWCLGSLLAGLAAWGTLLRPLDRQCAERQRQLIQDVRTNAALWPAVRKVPFRTETTEVRELTPFSPLDFQGDNATLVHWKPLQNGGELMLEVEWQALRRFFPGWRSGMCRSPLSRLPHKVQRCACGWSWNMRNSARYLLVCSALLLTGMRDPFRPPDDPCAIGELAQWRYRGMVVGQQAIGILQDGQKHWYRLKTHERFPAGWTITAINETELVVDVGDTCEPGTWTWQREGTDKNEFTDNAVADGVQPSAVGRRAKTGHAGGG